MRQTAFMGVGVMVGAGIFALLGAAGRQITVLRSHATPGIRALVSRVAGAAVWLSFLIAGAIAALQGSSFAKLGAWYRPAGGMATFRTATDAAGCPVVRCFVKGAAPAVMSRAATALPEAERLARTDRIGVIGRVAPEHEVLIADTLQAGGDVMGAVLFNITNGEPFSPAQVLWIHFAVNAPFGFALGFDRESPRLMSGVAGARDEPVLARPVLTTVGFAGLAITIGLLSMIQLGETRFGSARIGNSIAFTSSALCLMVAAFECRSETGNALTTGPFESRQMNRVALGELVLVVLVTQMDAMRRLLGTAQLDLREFAWALVPAVALLLLWELGKLTARRPR